MARYLIEDVSSGWVLGIYEGETADDALRAARRRIDDEDPDSYWVATEVPLAVIALKDGRDVRAVSELSDQQIIHMIAPGSPWVAMMDHGIRNLVQGWSTSPRQFIEDYAAMHRMCYGDQLLTIG